MLVQQYISEFNKQASNIAFLSYTDEIALANKLKLILGLNAIEDVSSLEVQDFFSNIYNLLCQSGRLKTELLGNCVDVLFKCVTSHNTKLRITILSDFRFLSVLIGNIMEHADDELKLINILTVVRELLTFSSELDEHNLKLIVGVLRDNTVNHRNKEIVKLCLQVLATLCLENLAARHLITRTIKTTEVKDKIKDLSDDLVAFKFFLIMEDELQPKEDVKYFFIMSLQELRKSVVDFSQDSVRNSLDILRHIERLGLELDTKLTEDEKFMRKLSELNNDLIVSLQETVASDAKWNFLDKILCFYNKILEIDNGLVEATQKFTEAAFKSGIIQKSSSALTFLASFIKYDGILETLEITIDKLLDVFITENTLTITYEQKYGFMSLLVPLQTKGKLSDGHLIIISEYFDDLIEQFKKMELSAINEEELFLFVYFLHALSNIAMTEGMFFGKLNAVLKLDFLPLLIAKAHLSRNEDILAIVFQLASVENFPNKKIVSLLAKSLSRSEAIASQLLHQSVKPRDIEMKNAKFINGELIDEMVNTIERINSKLDNNEEAKSSDITQIYRQKISYLNDHLGSITSSLDRCTTQINELNQKLASFRKISEKMEFANWSLQLDNERLISEAQIQAAENNMLKDSVIKFSARIDKEETKRCKTEEQLKFKNDENKRFVAVTTKLEEKLAETKERLRLANDENESRINELKESLENEKKTKSKELDDAIAEHKRVNQKLISAEKEVLKLRDIIKLNEKELFSKQEMIQKYEGELKEGEQMRSTILNLMQTKSFRK